MLERLGLGGQPLQPDHAYAVAREAGVSYEAAVRQLTHLEVITSSRAATLRQRRPLQVKADLALGRRPVNGYADVWPVNEDWDDQLLALRVEDEVVISLPENRSTGYRWMFPGERRHAEAAAPPPLSGERRDVIDPSVISALRSRLSARGTAQDTAGAPGVVLDRLRALPGAPPRRLPYVAGTEIVGDDYVPARAPWLPPRQARRQRIAQHSSPAGGAPGRSSGSAGPVVAATGRRVLGVRFPRPGPVTIRVQYQSRYNDDEPIEEYVLHALVEPRPVGFSVDQLAGDVDEPWTAQVRQRLLDRPLDPLDDDEELDADSDTDDPT